MIHNKIDKKIVIIIIISSSLLGLVYNELSDSGVPFVYTPVEYSQLTENNDGSSTPLLITLEQAIKFYDNKSIFFLDARDKWDYADGHIKGALNLPEYSFSTDSKDVINLSRDATYVIYCGGDDCDISKRLAEELSKMGFKYLFIYKGGFQEWKELGFPVE